MALFDIGMGNGLRNKLAEAIAHNDLKLGKSYVSTTYAFLGAIFLFALLLFHCINPFINWQSLLNTKSIPRNELYLITSIVVSFVILRFIIQTVTVVDAAHGDTAKAGILQVVISGISLLLIWLATLFTGKGNLLLLAIILTGVPVIVYILYSLFVFNRKYQIFKPQIKTINRSHSRSLVGLSLQFFVVQITATILYSSIPFVITQLFGPKEVTQFSITNSIFSLPVMLTNLVCAPAMPFVTQAKAKGDIIWLKATLKRLTYISYLFSVGTILLVFFAGFIYKLWIGNKVIIPFNLTVSIGLYTIISLLATPYSIFINGLGKLKILTMLAPLGVTMFVGFSIFFAHLFKDVYGISLALSLTSLVGLIVLPWQIKREFSQTNNSVALDIEASRI
jgi:O-antigen/teichoic acid export membrane protein